MEKIYEFLYCENNKESGFTTISVHRSRKGAERAMAYHRDFTREEFIMDFGSEHGWDKNQSWIIRETFLEQ